MRYDYYSPRKSWGHIYTEPDNYTEEVVYDKPPVEPKGQIYNIAESTKNGRLFASPGRGVIYTGRNIDELAEAVARSLAHNGGSVLKAQPGPVYTRHGSGARFREISRTAPARIDISSFPLLVNNALISVQDKRRIANKQKADAYEARSAASRAKVEKYIREHPDANERRESRSMWDRY